mgnify:FL=1
MSRKLIIYIILSITCMGIIFYFSSRNTIESNSTSKNLIRNVIDKYESITGKNINKESLVTKLNYPVRKLAHFSIYFLLGLVVYSLFLHTNMKHKLLFSILTCVVYALFDEIHQLFVLGRTGQVLDVFIDSMGSIIGMLIIKILTNSKTRHI